LASTINIAGQVPQAGAKTAPAQGAGAGPDGLMAFLNVLMGQGGAAPPGNDLAAKIASLLKNGAAGADDLTALLQKLYPNAGASQIQQAVTQLEAGAPDAATVKATLTSDLSSTFAPGLQENPDIMSHLQQKLDGLTQQGPVTADKLAQFRTDAISYMKSKGVDASAMDDYLVSLANTAGSALSTQLAAQLAMPVSAQEIAAAPPSPDAAPVSATAQASSSNNSSAAASGADNGDETQSPKTQAQAEGLPASPATDTSAAASQQTQADKKANAAEQAKAQAHGADKQAALSQAADDDAAAPAVPAQASNTAPEAKPLPAAALHFLAMNQSQGADAFGNSDNGQQASQNAGGQANTGSLTPNAVAANSLSFVNFMNSVPAAAATTTPATVQNIALQIQQNAQQGITTFTMQLEPAELGRLEVRLKFDRDGGIKAHLIADKPETLTALKNDSAQIHRILQQTGLDADENSLSFDLRQQGQQQGGDQSYSGSGQASSLNAGALGPTDVINANIAIQAAGYIRPGGVNIMV
jgi:flagellar hook-length control protein FliK